MKKQRDNRASLWFLLCFWVAVELLFSSRWWPPSRKPVSPQPPAGIPLRGILSSTSNMRVWFAPYISYPEPSFLESTARAGVYDTLLALPSNTAISVNYGANKLSPADTLFTWASVHGLSAEFRLARQLDYDFFALDLGALISPQDGVMSCREFAGCRLTNDSYALFPIRSDTSIHRALSGLRRRIPMLPWRGESRALSWGPLVFNQLQWALITIPVSGSLDGSNPFGLTPIDSSPLQIYRHLTGDYPPSVRPWLSLASDDVRLVLSDHVQKATLCIGPSADRCLSISLGLSRRSVDIGYLLRSGSITQIYLQAMTLVRPGGAPFVLELRLPKAAQSMVVMR